MRRRESRALSPYEIFENFSLTAGIGVTVLDVSGETRFQSSLCEETAEILSMIHIILDCGDAERVALLYGCYQARRFGGRYIFLAPSGLYYCACPLTEDKGRIALSVLAGPFLMIDRDEYIELDILGRHSLSPNDAAALRSGLEAIPVISPVRTRAVSEQLYVCAAQYGTGEEPVAEVNSALPPLAAYPLKKEDELLAAISMGDVQTAGALLNDILGQVLFQSGGDLEILRSRVVELAVLLSRAALKGGANIDAIFGLNYSFLREIDALGTRDDIILWLHGVTRRFAQHVFDFAGARHGDIIYRAVAYIKQNYADKITLQDVADHVYLSASYFSKVFRAETGQTPGEYIAAVRVEAAKKLLRDPMVNLVEVSALVGFESQSYFTRVFKKVEGCTPGRFRQKFLESGTVHD